ncbi:MAG TPA: T9SS type A sorting domain-containing protein, partial [Bacteroidia bacterium]|nr:T9SS type A sorting domain-containing protein [Bacteroidia bacterium]
TATGLAAGTYTASVTDSAGCNAMATVTLTQPTVLAIITSTVNSVCNGGQTGSASATVSGGVPAYHYSWSTAPAQLTSTATGLAAGSYTLTVTDTNSCVMTGTVTITQPAVISMTGSTVSASCGGSTGSATVSASGGTPAYTYSWNTTPAQTTATATGLSAGGYSVTITDMAGCSQSFGITVNNTGGATLTSSFSPASCFTSNNGTATVSASGGTSPYTYSWSTTPLQTGATATNLTPGNYVVQVADAVGCVSALTVTVGSPAAIMDSITPVNVSCSGLSNGSATASVSGGTPAYTYSWSTTPVQTTATATGLMAGTYTLMITDAHGCTAGKQTIIGQPVALTTSVNSTHTSCSNSADGSATANPTGGTAPYHYAWSTNPIQTTKTATGLAAGLYTVTVTDTNGCNVQTSVIVGHPAPIRLSVSTTNASCGNFDGTASVSVTGGGTAPFTYLWSPTGDMTATSSSLNAGGYIVTITDSSGCTQTDTALVSNSGVGPASISVLSGCAGANNGIATVSMASGTAPFMYSWSTTPVQTAGTAISLSPGNYTVMVTDSTGCIAFGTTTVASPAPLVIDSASIIHISCPTCSNAFATVTVTGGGAPYTYSWSSVPVQTTATASQLSPGTYTVCVTDVNGCTVCDSVVIDNSTGIEVYAGTLSRMTLYPNPTSGTLNLQIQSAESQELEMRVSNLLGQVLYSEKLPVTIGTQLKSYDFSSFPKGMYILQVLTPNESAAQRFILK